MERPLAERDVRLHDQRDLVGLLRQRAVLEGERTALTFLEGQAGQVFTYAALDERARRVGAALQRQTRPGQRALLLYEPGPEYLVALLGCLYAGVVAVPTAPPDITKLERALPPLQALVANAQIELALSTGWIAGLAADLAEVAPEVGALTWLATDALPRGSENEWQAPPFAGDDLAMLQYSAGTTGAPRGVMHTRENLWRALTTLATALGVDSATTMASWLPPYGGLGLFAGLLLPLFAGRPSFLLEPTAMLRQPLRWLEVIAAQRVTLSGAPAFAYDLCVRRTSAEERAGLDLSSWRVAFSGGEPVQPALLERFAAAFAPSGFQPAAFVPCYTIAEATCLAAGSADDGLALLDTHSNEPLVGINRVAGGPEILIVDPRTRAPRPEGDQGEIWLRGPSVGTGYWNRPEETRERFGAVTAGGEGGFVRTGDLGLLREGRLYVTGRYGEQLLVGGRGFDPRALEQTAEQSHQAIRPGYLVAFAVERGGVEQLVLAVEGERDATNGRQGPAELVAEVGTAVRQALAAAHGVDLHALILLRAGDLPRTAGGRPQRWATRAALHEGALNALAVSDVEARALLDFGSETTSIPSHADLKGLAHAERRALLETVFEGYVGEAGLDGLGALGLSCRIWDALGVRIGPKALLGVTEATQLASLTLAGLADAEPEGEQTVVAAQPAAPASFPLAYGQRAMWFLQQLAPASAAYTLTEAGQFIGQLDEGAMRRSLARLAERHPSLRTVFLIEDGEPVQQIREHGAIGLEIEDATAWSDDELAARMRHEVFRPFDLANGPLLRVILLRRSPEQTVVILGAHHIISDLWSLAMFMFEWPTLYAAEARGERAALARVTAPYADYVQWEREVVAGARGEELWRFWQQQLRGELPVLDLPTDRPRPQTPTYRGGTRATRLDPALSQAVKALARAHGATTFMAVLTAFKVLLHRYSGQEDMIVGVPRAARRQEWARTMGYLVNPLPLRTTLSPAASFAEHLSRVRETATAAFAHAELPFPLMVERLQLQRDLSRTPVFQVMLAWQKTVRLGGADALTPFILNQEGGLLPFGDMRLESLALEERVVPFDLTLLAGEAGDELFFSLEYNADLFDAATVERMLGELVTLVASAVAEPTRPVGQLSLLSDAERRRLLALASDGRPAPRADATIHARFAAQAARRPAAAALRWWDSPDAPPRQMSYGELARQAGLLASYLREQGVGPETVVGVSLERSPELIVALMGVLMAGGVFLPLDPAYPQERLRFMLADAGVKTLVTQQHLVGALGVEEHDGPHIVRLAADWPAIAAMGQAPADLAEGRHAAYIIYTSGSTGTPKGVVIEHETIAAHILTTIEHYALSEDDRVLQFASLNFDAALEQVFETLSCGAELVLRPDELWSPDELRRHAIEQGLSLINVPPAYWQQLVAAWDDAGEPAHRLRLVIVGGDQIQPESIVRWRGSPLAGVRLLNAYGPTETTITATTYELPHEGAVDARVPIGRPLAGRSAYILDAYGELAPLGVPGELFLGGAGVARGYLGRPALTAERFVADPFAARPGARMYRTGDLARLRSDGTIEFLGRADQQVKIRGFRVEPGEIESLLRRHPRVADAMVLPYAAGEGDVRLAAYLIATAEEPREQAVGGPPDQHEEVLTAGELRSYLRQSLPEFMLPSTFTALEAWPLTPSGKVDRRALPPPEATEAGTRAAPVAPRNALEAALTTLWGEVLGQPEVGVHDSFFELGGHSLLATRLITQVRELFGVELPLRALFESPTVAGMAAVLLEQLGVDEGTMAALLDELEGLSDEHAQALLEEGEA